MTNPENAEVAAPPPPAEGSGRRGSGRRGVPRRLALALAGTSAVGLLGVALAREQGAGAAPAPTAGGAGQPPTILAVDPALHLARRAAWGPTTGLVEQIRASGTGVWLDRQLQPS